MDNILSRIEEKVAELTPEFNELSKYIYDNPELGHEEFKSSKAHVDLLEKHDFEVEKPYLGFETAFRATYTSSKPGPTISYLAEYDALPGIGHGCGHNLLGTTSTASGIVLRYFIEEFGGRVVVLGTPAEETDGVKVDMAEADTFDDIDVAMCAHPSSSFTSSGSSMAIDAIEFTFKGKNAHAASNPHEGINALDAVISLFVNVGLWRQQLHSTARVHGIISEGGKAANVIPDLAKAEFYIRARKREELEEMRERIINIAQASALSTGCTMSWRYYEKSNDDMRTNPSLSNTFNENMKALGIEVEEQGDGFGSTDMGNVSHVCPAIHPYFGITNEVQISSHTPEFRDSTLTDYAKDSMQKTITGLVKTGIDVISNPSLLESIKEDFKKQQGK